MDLTDHILSTNLISPEEYGRELAGRARQRRLEADLSQAGLAKRAGITTSSLKRFERTGEIALERLVRIAVALGASSGFELLLAQPLVRSLDEIIAAPGTRQRGRRR